MAVKASSGASSGATGPPSSRVIAPAPARAHRRATVAPAGPPPTVKPSRARGGGPRRGAPPMTLAWRLRWGVGRRGVVAGRYSAGGTKSNGLYIRSGSGIALFLGVRLLMFKLK